MGNPDAKDWQDVARQIVEKTMSHCFFVDRDGDSDSIDPDGTLLCDTPSPYSDELTAGAHILSDFDKHRETLLEANTEEGWASELRRFQCAMHQDVTKYTDLVVWVRVCQVGAGEMLAAEVDVEINQNTSR